MQAILSSKSILCRIALCADGNVHAWGYNAVGELGLGNNSNMNVPQFVITLP
ncbi:MAG: RCC1 domain-containing protein [Candidatus Brocadiia bacterium]